MKRLLFSVFALCGVMAAVADPANAVKAKVLTGDSPDAYNTIENPDRVHIEEKVFPIKDNTIELPAHTMAIVTVE